MRETVVRFCVRASPRIVLRAKRHRNRRSKMRCLPVRFSKKPASRVRFSSLHRITLAEPWRSSSSACPASISIWFPPASVGGIPRKGDGRRTLGPLSSLSKSQPTGFSMEFIRGLKNRRRLLHSLLETECHPSFSLIAFILPPLALPEKCFANLRRLSQHAVGM